MTKQILTHNYSLLRQAISNQARSKFLHLDLACQVLFITTLVKEMNETNNDPSAGSPTETLLRLLLPLNDQV